MGREGRESVAGGAAADTQGLLVYKQAYALALRVSELTKSFPRHEQYELGRQLRNSSRSVAANIAEGWAKNEFRCRV